MNKPIYQHPITIWWEILSEMENEITPYQLECKSIILKSPVAKGSNGRVIDALICTMGHKFPAYKSRAFIKLLFLLLKNLRWCQLHLLIWSLLFHQVPNNDNHLANVGALSSLTSRNRVDCRKHAEQEHLFLLISSTTKALWTTVSEHLYTSRSELLFLKRRSA